MLHVFWAFFFGKIPGLFEFPIVFVVLESSGDIIDLRR